MYTDLLDDRASIRMRKRKAASGQSKFITPEVRKAIRKRKSLKQKFNKTRKTDDWEAYPSVKKSRGLHEAKVCY